MGCAASVNDQRLLAQQALGPGVLVTFKNVADPKFVQINGRQGTIKHWDETKQRWLIDGQDGTPYLLKSTNLQVAQPHVTQVIPHSTPSQATCNSGHSLSKCKIQWDPNSADENLRRPVLCDDCFDTLPENEKMNAIIRAEYAMQCNMGCDFALCDRHYELRAGGGQSQAAAGQKPGKGGKATATDRLPGQAPPQDPDPKRIKFADPRSNKGQQMGVIGFYFPGYACPWDTWCKAGFLGNFYEVRPERVKVEGTANGRHTSHSFGNAEAAFQALKFWSCADIFEPLSGDAAFSEKRRLAGQEDRSYAGHGSNWEGMLAVLKAKFKLKAMEKLLLKTDDAYLLEHNSVFGRDDIWSDNCDGTGMNWLGLQLMLLRDELRKKSTWTPYIQQCVDTNTGAFLNKVGEDHWRDTVRRARKAVVDELDKSYPGQLLPIGCFKCQKASCGKPSWNGQPNEYCSKLCKTSLFMSSYYSFPAVGGGLFGNPAPARTYNCSKPGCSKPTWNNQPNEYCSRSCRSEAQASAAFPAFPAHGAGHGAGFGAAGGAGQAGAVNAVPMCLRAGCGKPTWNGLPNEFCSKACRPPAQQQPARMGGGMGGGLGMGGGFFGK